MFGIRLPDCSKLAVNWKSHNDVIIFLHDVIINFFDAVLFLLSSLVTGPSFMSISLQVLELWQFPFIRDWPEICKSEMHLSLVWVLVNIWRLAQVRNTKFATNVSNKMLLNAAKWQGYSYYRFWVIKGKPTGGQPRLGLAQKQTLFQRF